MQQSYRFIIDFQMKMIYHVWMDTSFNLMTNQTETSERVNEREEPRNECAINFHINVQNSESISNQFFFSLLHRSFPFILFFLLLKYFVVIGCRLESLYFFSSLNSLIYLWFSQFSIDWGSIKLALELEAHFMLSTFENYLHI